LRVKKKIRKEHDQDKPMYTKNQILNFIGKCKAVTAHLDKTIANLKFF